MSEQKTQHDVRVALELAKQAERKPVCICWPDEKHAMCPLHGRDARRAANSQQGPQ